MNRRTKTSDAAAAAAVCLSPGSPSMAGPSIESGAESGVESDSSSGGRMARERGQLKRRSRQSRPAVEDIIDGFSICSFETVKDLTLFIEKKTAVQAYLESSSSSESEYELQQPFMAKSCHSSSLSSPAKLDWKRAKSKHFQFPKFDDSCSEYVESSDRLHSPVSINSVIKSVNKTKVKTDVLRSDNHSTGSGVSASSTCSKIRKQVEDELDEKDSSELAAFSCISGAAFHEEDEKCNITSNCCESALDELDNEQSKLDRLSVAAAALTDAESESSVVLVKEELKDKDWGATQTGSWPERFPMEGMEGIKRLLDNETQRFSDFRLELKQSLESKLNAALSSYELNGKWADMKEKPSVVKTEKGFPLSDLQSKHPYSPCFVPHSHSFEKQRTTLDNGLRLDRDYDFPVSSKTKVINVDSPTRSDSHKKSRLDSFPRVSSSSSELRTSSLKSREGAVGISKSSCTPVTMTLASTEIKNECPSPISVRGSSSHQSSSRSSVSHKKSSSNSHPIGNDFNSHPLIDRNLHSPLPGHSAYHAGGRPHHPAAFNMGGGLPMSGLFGPPLSQFPVSGLHPSSGLLGSSMGLHPSLLMAGMNSVAANPVATNPDLFQVQQELNARFLQDHRLLPVGFPPMPLTLRTETHQHQHLHHHQHLVPGPYMPALPATFSVASHPLSVLQTMGPGGIDLLSHSQTLSDLAERERISKMRASLNIFDGSLPPSYASLISGMPPPPHGAGLNPNMHGAFTINESKPSSLSASHLLRSLRNDQQVTQQSTIPSSSAAKKNGRWCAAHVDIAFKIYYHRQRSMSQESMVHGRLVVPGGCSNNSGLTGGGMPHMPSLPSAADVAGNGIGSFHKPHLQFGISSFLRPTPQPLHPADANRFSSSPYIPRPRNILPGGVPKVESSHDLKPSSSTLRSGVGSDGNLLTSADQDCRRKSDRDIDDWSEKKRKLDSHFSVDHRISAAKSGHSSQYHPLAEKSGLHRNAELNRTQRLPESRSPMFLSSDRSFRQNLDSKKREHLALPLSIDTKAAIDGGPMLGGMPGTGGLCHLQSNVPPMNFVGPGVMPGDSGVALQMDRDRLQSLDSLHRDRDRPMQPFCGQSFAGDADRFRNLLPSHPPYGLSLNGLSKQEHKSFKPYADLSLRLETKPTLDIFKPNPEGLFIVSSSASRHFSNNSGNSVSSVPPPLVRLPPNDGLSSYKRHAPYSSLGNGLSDYSSSLCGLPGGDGALQLPFR